MSVLVTGAAGFIGSHLVDSLLRDGGEDVVGIDSFVDYYPRAIKERNLEAARRDHRFRFVAGALQDQDLGSLLQDEDVSVVYHLAAQAGVRASWGRDFDVYAHNNVSATQRLLEAASTLAKPPRIVYASSSSVYGDSPALPLREDAACHPVSPYGVTKLAAEHLGLLYERNNGVPVVALRYFTVYGPRQRPDMAFHKFLKAARDGTELTIFGDGEQTRDFTYIDDILAAVRAAASRGRPGGVYNVGGGERISVNGVLEVIEEVTGRKLRTAHAGAQKGDMRDTFADTAAARADLGFRSTVPLRDGLAREWEWIESL